MAPDRPWRTIPEWFYDKKPVSWHDADCDDALSVYARIQHYFGRNISRRAVDEFLFGHKIKQVELFSLESEPSGSLNKWTIKAAMRLPNGNEAEFKQTLCKEEKGLHVDLIKPVHNEDAFPEGYTQEYFGRAVPALRELGIEKITLNAYSNYNAGYYGACVWCRYGFTNEGIRLTLQKYVLYLEDYYCIYLDARQRDAIMRIDRMNDLVDEKVNGKEIAREFLLGKRAACEWNGIIPDIFDETSIEMKELMEYLLRKEKI